MAHTNTMDKKTFCHINIFVYFTLCSLVVSFEPICQHCHSSQYLLTLQQRYSTSSGHLKNCVCFSHPQQNILQHRSRKPKFSSKSMGHTEEQNSEFLKFIFSSPEIYWSRLTSRRVLYASLHLNFLHEDQPPACQNFENYFQIGPKMIVPQRSPFLPTLRSV